jgi:hypothetical protein
LFHLILLIQLGFLIFEVHHVHSRAYWT